jgi:hypothetical protein
MRNVFFAAAMLIAATSAASASTYVVKFSGTIGPTDQFDADLQGLPGSAFNNGDVVSGSITFDSAKTDRVPFMPGRIDFQNKPSESAFGPLTFAIGSHNFAYTNVFDVQLQDPGTGSQGVMFAGLDGSGLFYGMGINGTDLFSDIDNLQSLLTFSGEPGYLYFVQETPGATLLTNINLTSVTISSTPIPATLPLFASALGGLGFMLRRHRKTAAAMA